MTTIINLFGGSGIGKSTTAALLFGEMKLQGYHCELVREFVKEWAWQKRKIGPADQEIIYKEQKGRESFLYGCVDYIITDSPLLLSPIYQKFYTGDDPIAVRAFIDYEENKNRGVRYLNVLLDRQKPFDTRGRYETEEQARQVDSFLKSYLEEMDVPFHVVQVPERERTSAILDLLRGQSNG